MTGYVTSWLVIPSGSEESGFETGSLAAARDDSLPSASKPWTLLPPASSTLSPRTTR
jgi:hypothetical protein